jgi:hypothetical protein
LIVATTVPMTRAICISCKSYFSYLSMIHY